MSKPRWIVPTHVPRRPLPSEVHLWSASLSELASYAPVLWGMLAPAERKAASRLIRSIDWNRAVFGRGMLRTLLGAYVGNDPAALTFIYGSHGKPSLDLVYRDAPAFSLSHSGDLVLVAVGAPGSEIGVDLEQHRAVPEWLDIATRHFHDGETGDLLTLPQSRQLEAFFDCWTRKEAVVKAFGLGLSLSLWSFRVPLLIDQSAGWVAWSGPEEYQQCSLLVDLSPASGYSAALACRGPRHRDIIHRWRFAGSEWLGRRFVPPSMGSTDVRRFLPGDGPDRSCDVQSHLSDFPPSS